MDGGRSDELYARVTMKMKFVCRCYLYALVLCLSSVTLRLLYDSYVWLDANYTLLTNLFNSIYENTTTVYTILDRTHVRPRQNGSEILGVPPSDY